MSSKRPNRITVTRDDGAVLLHWQGDGAPPPDVVEQVAAAIHAAGRVGDDVVLSEAAMAALTGRAAGGAS